MPRRRDNSEDKTQGMIRDFIITPVIVLFGIYIAGVLAESLFSIPKAALYIFQGVGGVGFLVVYFKNRIKEHFRIG